MLTAFLFLASVRLHRPMLTKEKFILISEITHTCYLIMKNLLAQILKLINQLPHSFTLNYFHIFTQTIVNRKKRIGLFNMDRKNIFKLYTFKKFETKVKLIKLLIN